MPRLKGLTPFAASIVSLITIGQFKQVNTPVRALVTNQSSRTMSEAVVKSRNGALWGMLIADAISMPVHWYYNPGDIKRGYGGWLTQYTAPNKKHPSSILTLSAIDGSGRTGWHGKSTQVVGSIILHDKLKYWQGDRSTHYHQGMKAGDNTLNSVISLLLYTTLQRVNGNGSSAARDARGLVLEEYVKFMTTPDTHNDTYAESFHRLFFKEWSQLPKKITTADDLLEFCEKRTTADSQLASIGVMSSAIPWVLHNVHKTEDQCVQATIDYVKCTHPTAAIIPYVDIYARLLYRTIQGQDLKQEVMKALSHPKLVNNKQTILKLHKSASGCPIGSEAQLQACQMATQTLGSACYIEGALSSMLFLAYTFADDFEQGVFMNANCGGENCHRGSALGALLGAQAANQGQHIPQYLQDGLTARRDVIKLCQEQAHM